MSRRTTNVFVAVSASALLVWAIMANAVTLLEWAAGAFAVKAVPGPTVNIEVKADGRILVDGTDVPLEALPHRLAEAKTAEPSARLSIIATEPPESTIEAVAEAAIAAGFSPPGIVTAHSVK